MLLLLLVISNVLLPTVQCSDQFEVLRFSNVPFPSSSSYAAHLNGTFHTGLTEFTVCVRFLIESYNEGALGLFRALGDLHRGGKITYVTNYFEDISNGLGWGTRGFQGGVINFFIGIPDGGMINKRFPINHHFNAANKIETSTWNHLCTSYSSKITRIHMFQDGLKVFSYQYKDPHDIPMPAKTFGDTRIGWNMRGLISDINIHSTFFDEDSMRSLTLTCGEMQGDIFKWDARKWNSRKKPVHGNFFHERTESVLGSTLCDMKRTDPFLCMFLTEPTFRLRGLCKNAVMDTQYKLSEHTPGELSAKKQDTRGYVGPKGWIISRNRTDKKWRMSHYFKQTSHLLCWTRILCQ